MSNKCTEEPEFTKYEAVQKRCRGKHNDRQCKNVASRFTKIFQKSCCGKDECAAGLPPKCGASCADAFLPYFSRCGSAQYGDKLKQFGDMEKFSRECAAAKKGAEIPGPDDTD